MREIILAEGVIVREEPSDTAISLGGSFLRYGHGYSSQRLNLAAVLLPLLKRLALLLCHFLAHIKRVNLC